jgi:hypothetical protein
LQLTRHLKTCPVRWVYLPFALPDAAHDFGAQRRYLLVFIYLLCEC